MPARIIAVLVGYVIYRLIEPDHFAAGVFIGFGTLVLDWTVIDYLTVPATDRSRLMQAGSLILGLGLIGIGLTQL